MLSQTHCRQSGVTSGKLLVLGCGPRSSETSDPFVRDRFCRSYAVVDLDAI